MKTRSPTLEPLKTVTDNDIRDAAMLREVGADLPCFGHATIIEFCAKPAMDIRLDDLDRDLLSLLQANARESTANLARKLKLARTTVVARIARLERGGIVSGYGVRLGHRLEHAAIRAFCGLTVNAKSAPAVISALERMPEVEEVWAVSGQVDYMVLLRCDTPERLDQLIDQMGQIDGIKQTQTSIVLSRKIDRRSTVSYSAQSHPPE